MSKTVTEKPIKTVSPLDEARKLQTLLDRIDRREREAAHNAAVRYQAERNDLLGAASKAALRIIEAAKSEVAG